MDNRSSLIKKLNRYSTLKHQNKTELTVLRTPIQNILNNTINTLLISHSNKQQTINECWLNVQKLIKENISCTDQPDSNGNSTLYYVTKLRQHRWIDGFNHHYMNLITQICDFVENRYLNNISTQLYLYLSNMDGINNDVAGYILKFIIQLSHKTYDGNFDQFIASLRHYCNSNNTESATRNHIYSVKKILGHVRFYTENTGYRSDLGIGKILFDLSKIQIDPSDELSCIIRNTKRITGYTTSHFQNDTDDSLNFIFDEKNCHGREGWIYAAESWLHLIFEVVKPLSSREHYIKILLNAGLISSNDIIDYFIKNSQAFNLNQPIFIMSDLFIYHLNALGKNEIADVINYLLRKNFFYLTYHLLSNIENKETLEIHENNLLKIFIDSISHQHQFPQENILKIAKLLIESEPRCALQLENNDIKHYFSNAWIPTLKNEIDELDALVKQTLLKLEYEQEKTSYLLAHMSLFSKQEICSDSDHDIKNCENTNSNTTKYEESQPAGSGYGF